MIHAKKSFAPKSWFSPFTIPLPTQEKNREIKRVLNDFVVTYQKNIPPTNLAKNSAT